MDLNKYQMRTNATARYPLDMALPYTALGLVGEAGEVAEKIKKIIRDKAGVVSREDARSIALELGDVMWYVSQLSSELGFDLSDIAQMNLDKLSSRQSRGVLSGNGDDR